MATSVYFETAERLRELAKKHPRVLVSYSGGKDSSVCLDMCFRSGFTEIQPFFMYLVPGLKFVQDRLDWAEQKYGVKIMHVPHWMCYKYLREEIFCSTRWTVDLPEIRTGDINAVLCERTGISLVINGGKKSDGLWRKRFIWGLRNNAALSHPIENWNKWDVYAYLKTNNIAVTKDSVDMGAKGAGVGLHPRSLLWIYDNHPDDFKKIEKVYPYARSVVYRREWYNIGPDYRGSGAPEEAEEGKEGKAGVASGTV